LLLYMSNNFIVSNQTRGRLDALKFNKKLFKVLRHSFNTDFNEVRNDSDQILRHAKQVFQCLRVPIVFV